VITAPLPVYAEGDPETALVYVAGATYIVDAGVLIDLAAPATETAAFFTLSPPAGGCCACAQRALPRRHLPISFVGLLRPVRRLSLAAKAALYPDFDKEALISAL